MGSQADSDPIAIPETAEKRGRPLVTKTTSRASAVDLTGDRPSRKRSKPAEFVPGAGGGLAGDRYGKRGDAGKQGNGPGDLAAAAKAKADAKKLEEKQARAQAQAKAQAQSAEARKKDTEIADMKKELEKMKKQALAAAKKPQPAGPITPAASQVNACPDSAGLEL
jgi:hypothetical protein